MKETPLPQKPEFLIAVHTPEELVIKFDLPGTKPVIKMILIGMFLLGIGLTLAIPFSHFYGWSLDGLALAASIALPAFWGVDLVFFLILTSIPAREPWRIDMLQDRVQEHSIYVFRKKDKIIETSITDIAWLHEQRSPSGPRHFFELVLVLHDGREIILHNSGHLEVIEGLYEVVDKYLPAAVKRVVSVFKPRLGHQV